MEFVTSLASYLTALSVLVGVVSKVLDVKLKGLYNNERLQYRYEICSFAGDLRNNITKTREEFEAVFEMYDTYEELISKLKQKNSYIDSEMAYIKEQYKKI